MIKKIFITIAVIYLCIFMFYPFSKQKKMKRGNHYEK